MSGDSEDFSGVSGPVLNLMASFLGLEFPEIPELNSRKASFGGMGSYTPHPLPFGAAELLNERHISTALRSSPLDLEEISEEK